MLRVLLYPQEQRAFIPISASQLELAERVKFPEKNAWFGYFEVPFGGEGVHCCEMPIWQFRNPWQDDSYASRPKKHFA